MMTTYGAMKTAAGKSARGKLFFNRLIAAMALIVLTGCTTMQAYPGSQLPREKLAVIERRAQIVTLAYGMTIYITTIDGTAVDGLASEIEVLPGTHEILLTGQTSAPLALFPLTLLMQPKFGPNKLTFRAEAGRSYRLVTAEVETNAYWVWVQNEEGEVAGGESREPMARPKRGERDDDDGIDRNE
jgi:hypothetical protein